MGGHARAQQRQPGAGARAARSHQPAPAPAAAVARGAVHRERGDGRHGRQLVQEQQIAQRPGRKEHGRKPAAASPAASLRGQVCAGRGALGRVARAGELVEPVGPPLGGREQEAAAQQRQAAGNRHAVKVAQPQLLLRHQAGGGRGQRVQGGAVHVPVLGLQQEERAVPAAVHRAGRDQHPPVAGQGGAAGQEGGLVRGALRALVRHKVLGADQHAAGARVRRHSQQEVGAVVARLGPLRGAREGRRSKMEAGGGLEPRPPGRAPCARSGSAPATARTR